MNYLEAIVEIKNVVGSEFTNRIISLIKTRANKNLLVGEKNKLNLNTRNVKGYQLDFRTPTNLFYWNYVKNEITRLYGFYKAKFPLMFTDKINQIDLLKYSVGGKYEVHTDHFSSTVRNVSIIINLNDDYEGGDLVFTNQQKVEVKKIKLEKGSIVFFPSNFMYPHSIKPITKGVRYSIVSWLQ
jgi:predicted 2-oxoglutarate/Fe(II)-dependent dioxygenase YbiX